MTSRSVKPIVNTRANKYCSWEFSKLFLSAYVPHFMKLLNLGLIQSEFSKLLVSLFTCPKALS
ncbi:MAG TPA: hypothetical protein DDZ90_12525 [Planctomycetaceae bacterium]|nr:hypothetical protein [Gimesia sp.]HBL44209.1 hypothetical protein [Planctomycetaceae bacterium]